MAGGNAAKNIAVGLIFLGSLVVLGVATLFVTDVSLVREVEAVTVRFPHVDNLRTGDNVVAYGMRVGQVDTIDYAPEASSGAPVLVTLSVTKDLSDRVDLTDGTSTFTIRSSGPLGGHFLEIFPPTSTEPGILPAGNVGKSSGDLFQKIGDLISENRKSITDLITHFDEAATEIRNTFQTVNAGQGTIGALVNDKELGDETRKGLRNLFDVVANLKGEEGVIPYLLNSKEAKEEVRAGLRDLRQIIGELKAGKGLAGRLINDSQLADRVTDVLENLQEIVQKANRGQGTIGQALNNPKAWNEFVRLLVLTRESLEDFREQAPITTFVNAAFAAF
jgi:ABC-type transporter Mla subunit MlaD